MQSIVGDIVAVAEAVAKLGAVVPQIPSQCKCIRLRYCCIYFENLHRIYFTNLLTKLFSSDIISIQV